MPKKYKHLSEEDRDRLAVLKARGKGVREIAKLIGRNVGTVSRELQRNKHWLYADQHDYLPHYAQARADQRKAKGHERKRLREKGLISYVTRMLRIGWSPERIAGRWKLNGGKPISYEAIYQWIYAERRDLVSFLLRAHRSRRKRARKSKPRASAIPSRTPISKRPKHIELRREAGHWEGDTIVSSRSLQVLQVVVERATRKARLIKLPRREAKQVKRSICGALIGLPKRMRKTITYDNGSENTHHVQINKRLGTKSYFCQPMRSWEKGSVENIAGLVRRRLPKGTDFAKVSPSQIRKVEHWLNSLPKKCLGFKTPAEEFRRRVALKG